MKQCFIIYFVISDTVNKFVSGDPKTIARVQKQDVDPKNNASDSRFIHGTQASDLSRTSPSKIETLTIRRSHKRSERRYTLHEAHKVPNRLRFFS